MRIHYSWEFEPVFLSIASKAPRSSHFLSMQFGETNIVGRRWASHFEYSFCVLAPCYRLYWINLYANCVRFHSVMVMDDGGRWQLNSTSQSYTLSFAQTPAPTRAKPWVLATPKKLDNFNQFQCIHLFCWYCLPCKTKKMSAFLVYECNDFR